MSDWVYRQLLYWLLRGELHPGQLINRRQIAERLRVSVAPVMEAMLALERDGLFETIPRRGTRVRYFQRRDIRGQVALRIAIEAQAATMYYGKPIRRQEAALTELAANVDTSPPQSFASWHAEILFHRALVKLADAPAMLETFDRVMRCTLFVPFSVLESVTGRTNDHAGHCQLVRALTVADVEQATRLIREHLMPDHSARLLDPCGESEMAAADSCASLGKPHTSGNQKDNDSFIDLLASMSS